MIMGEFGMKKYLAVLASLSILLMAGVPAFAAKHKKSADLDRTFDRTVVRSSENNNGHVVAIIPSGQTVTVLNGCKSWCLIRWKGVKGYVDSCHLDDYGSFWGMQVPCS
jgi:hypothetical protein